MIRTCLYIILYIINIVLVRSVPGTGTATLAAVEANEGDDSTEAAYEVYRSGPFDRRYVQVPIYIYIIILEGRCVTHESTFHV